MKFRKINKSEWKKLIVKEGDSIPPGLIKYLEGGSAFRSGWGGIYNDMVYFKGENIDSATEWACVMDDGGYYKVNAEYAFWHPNEKNELVLHCSWTYSHLKKNVKHFLTTGGILRDPKYTT